MRSTLACLAALVAASTASAAFAKPIPWLLMERISSEPVPASRMVYVCDRSLESQRAWERAHGQMTFISAEQFMQAEATGETWSAPRCITAGERQRLDRVRDEAPSLITVSSAR